jgi:hypothetical protein
LKVEHYWIGLFVIVNLQDQSIPRVPTDAADKNLDEPLTNAAQRIMISAE